MTQLTVLNVSLNKLILSRQWDAELSSDVIRLARVVAATLQRLESRSVGEGEQETAD